MDLMQLEGLKQRLVDTERFDSVAEEFALGACLDDSFLELGEFIESSMLAGIIRAAGRKCFGRESRIEQLALIWIETANFVHGSFILDGCMANLMFFEDVGVGVVSIAALSPHPTTEFVRFSACPQHNPNLN